MSNPYSPTPHGGTPMQKPIMGGPQKTNGLAIAAVSMGGASLAMNLFGICCCLGWFAPALSIGAIVCGVIGLGQIKQTGEKGKEMCYAGLGMGIAGPLILVGGVILRTILQIGAMGAQNFGGQGGGGGF